MKFVPMVRMVRMVIVTSLFVGAVMPVAFANDTAIQNCRLVKDNTARLACYDGINLPSGPSASTSVTSPSKGAPVVTPSASPVPGANPGANDTAADFGLPSVVRAAQLEKIASSIPGRFVSWQTGSRIDLANGQVWLVIDDSRGICECDNPKVVVSRGSFGTFFLEIEGKGNAPRVRRVK